MINKLNKKNKKIPQASSIYWNQIVQDRKLKKKITVLSLGEAFFKIKKFNLNHHLKKEVNYHYSDSRGFEKLRIKILNLYNKKYGCTLKSKNEILISAGSKIISYFVFLTLLEKNDEVLTTEPAWLSYREQIYLCGAKIKFLKFNEKIQNIEKKITKKTKIFLLNNPNNPTGKYYSKKEINLISKICKKKGVFFICDEAYSDYLNFGEKYFSAIHCDKNLSHTIVINSLSKNFGMSGWRLGYVIANKKIIDRILVLNQHLITCAPTILQDYVTLNFEKLFNDNLKKIRKVMIKRKKIYEFLKKIELKFLEGSSTFYFFISIPKKINTYNLCKKLLFKNNISFVPGDAYGKSVKNFVRMSIGTESLNNIKKALLVLKSYL